MFLGKRYALVRGLELTTAKVAPYLPTNYKVEGEVQAVEFGREVTLVVIGGRDSHGWSLDKYVIPRLGSGMMACEEIDLSHPVMKKLEG